MKGPSIQGRIELGGEMAKVPVRECAACGELRPVDLVTKNHGWLCEECAKPKPKKELSNAQ